MNGLTKLLTLEPLKGNRTKYTVIAGVLLYLVSQYAPQYISVEQFEQLKPILLSIGAYFGIEHFEAKKS